MPNPFKRIDVLILEIFGAGSKETNEKLDKLQATVDAARVDIGLIKSVLLVDESPSAIEEIDTALETQVKKLEDLAGE